MEEEKLRAAEVLGFIQNRLRAKKDQRNAFGGYKYRNAEGILEALKPLIEEARSKFNTPIYIINTDDVEVVGDKYFLKATATLHVGAYTVESSAMAELGQHKGMSAEQCTGSASSYARKYAMCGLFAIDDSSNDPDTMEPLTELQQALNQVGIVNSHAELDKLWHSVPTLHNSEELLAACRIKRLQLNAKNE